LGEEEEKSNDEYLGTNPSCFSFAEEAKNQDCDRRSQQRKIDDFGMEEKIPEHFCY
jgi:hypothetical protein